MENKYQKPNFFIIGFPRSGTTSLSHYLNERSDVCMSNIKEPGFFNFDRKSKNGPKFKSIEDYLNTCFRETKNKKYKAVGEASTIYIYSNEAVPNILNFNPEAKFIIMLRNPVDMIYSMHSQALFSRNEKIEDFKKAWKKNDIYKKKGKLGERLEWVMNHVPEEKIHIIFFKDFTSQTKEEYKKVLNFLNVPYKGKEEFPVINSNKKIRSRIIANLITLLAKFKRKILTNRSWGIGDKLIRTNAKKTKRDPMTPKLRKEIINYFKNDIKKLSKITNRNLDYWIKEK